MQRPSRYLDGSDPMMTRGKRGLDSTDVEASPEPKRQKVPALARFADAMLLVEVDENFVLFGTTIA